MKIIEPSERGVTPNRNHRPNNKHIMSVKDMVSYTDGKDEKLYLPNYEIKKWDHDIDKPRIAMFHKDVGGKPRHYMDPFLKTKKGIPGPGHYPMKKEPFIFKQNMCNQKAPRSFISTDIEKAEKKKRFPEAATYKINYKPTEPKLLGCFKFKGERHGYVDECMLLGK
jgi:hypothetical protein